MFERILVPLDQDGLWRDALGQALALARAFGSTLLGIHALAPDRGARSEAGRATAEGGRALLTAFSEGCAGAGIPGRATLEVGSPAHVVLERTHRADLVVLARHWGSDGGRPAVIFDALVDHARVPIWVVPDSYREPACIILAFDDSARAERALRCAVSLRRAMGWPIELLVVNEDERASDASTLRALGLLHEAGSPPTFSTTVAGPYEEAISRASQPDTLVVFGARSYGPLPERALEGLAKVAVRMRGPVLVCR